MCVWVNKVCKSGLRIEPDGIDASNNKEEEDEKGVKGRKEGEREADEYDPADA